MDEFPDFDQESPYRMCEICLLNYLVEFGGVCEECDIWICKNCWNDHITAEGHP